MSSPDDLPTTVAYRTRQLEVAVGDMSKQVTDGFVGVHQKLDTLKEGFVTHEQFTEAITASDKIHADHETRLNIIEKDSDQIKGAMIIVKVMIGLLTGMAAILGSLWWAVK